MNAMGSHPSCFASTAKSSALSARPCPVSSIPGREHATQLRVPNRIEIALQIHVTAWCPACDAFMPALAVHSISQAYPDQKGSGQRDALIRSRALYARYFPSVRSKNPAMIASASRVSGNW